MKISNEESMLIGLSRLRPLEADLNFCREIKCIDNNKFMSLVLEHKVGSLIYKNIIEYKLDHLIQRKWISFLEVYYLGILTRNNYVYDQISIFLNELYYNGIKCIPLKGVVLNDQIYSDLGIRFSNDTDILIQEKDLQKTTEILSSFGFIQGDIVNGQLVPATRGQKIFHKLSTHELVPFVYQTNDPACPFLIIDVHFDVFSRSKNMRIEFNIDNLFDTAELTLTNRKKAFCYFMKPQYNLLQLTSHLYQDATRIQSILELKDLELMKFTDIYEYLLRYQGEIDWMGFADEIKKQKVNHIVYYAFYYTEMIFGDLHLSEFMIKIRPDRIHYLNQFGFEEKEFTKWENPFLQRLFDQNRVKQIKQINQVNIVEAKRYKDIINKLKNNNEV